MSVTFEKVLIGMELWTDMMYKYVSSRFDFMYVDDGEILPRTLYEKDLVELVTSYFGWDDTEFETHLYIIVRIGDSGVEMLFLARDRGALRYAFGYRYDCGWSGAKSYVWANGAWRKENFINYTDEFAYLMHASPTYIDLEIPDTKKAYVQTKRALNKLLGWGLKYIR